MWEEEPDKKYKISPARDILIRVYSVPCDLVKKQLLQNMVVFACISFLSNLSFKAVDKTVLK